jgi:sigma-B regulation protein RsbU (phosphoserine phosphatase)
VRGRTTHEQGLGLGLYIASEIAKMHGGKVEATSTPQETRFVFRMPLMRS